MIWLTTGIRFKHGRVAAKGTLLKLWLGICSKYQLHTSPGKIFIGSTILWPIILHFLSFPSPLWALLCSKEFLWSDFPGEKGNAPGCFTWGDVMGCDSQWERALKQWLTLDLRGTWIYLSILSLYHSPVQHPLNAALVSPELTIPTAQTKPGSLTDTVNKINIVWFWWYWEFFLLPGKFLLVRLV